MTLPAALARGAVAGLAGTGAMTAFQRLVEMPLTGRADSFAPADLVTRLLPVRPTGRTRRRVNSAAHVAVGAAWGAAHGVAGHAGLRGQHAVATVFGVLYVGDVVANTALGLYEPHRWSARDWAIDVVDKLVLAEATGLVHDRLVPAPVTPAA